MALVEYDISVVGMGRVQQALAGVEQRFAAHNRRVTQAMGGPAAARRAASPADNRRSLTGLAEIGKAARTAELRDARKHFQAIEREKLSSERKMSQGLASIGKAARMAELRAERDTIRERVSTRRMYGRAVMGGLKNAGGAIASVGKMGLQAAGIGGGALAYGAVRDAVKLDESVRRLLIQGRGPGGKVQPGTEKLTPKGLQSQIEQTAIETGTAPEDIAKGLSTFVSKTGDVKTAVDNMKVFATVAQGAGASVEDVAGAAADLSQKFDLKKTEDMADALAALTFQGKAGAFELKYMAAQFPSMAAKAAGFGLKGAGGVRTLGGLAQIAMQATGQGEGGAAEAATSIEQMFTQLQAKASHLQSGAAFGGRKVSVYEGGKATGRNRDITKIIPELINASRGDIGALGKVLDVRGMRAVQPLANVYKEAYLGAGGDKGGKKAEAAGTAAVQKMLRESIDTAGTYKDVQSDAGEAMKASSVQWEIAMTKLKVAMSGELLPALTKLIPEIAKMAPEVASITRGLIGAAKWLLENPWKGLGALVAAALIKELAMAKLGQILTNALAGGGGKGLPGAGAPGVGVGGALATAGAAVAVTAAVSEADKLQKLTGSKSSVLDIIPGFKGGSFSVGELGSNLVDPRSTFQKTTTVAGDLMSEAGFGPPKMKRSVGRAQFSAQVETAKRGLTTPEQAGSIDQLATAAKNAAAELAKLKAEGLNRGNAPSPAVK